MNFIAVLSTGLSHRPLRVDASISGDAVLSNEGPWAFDIAALGHAVWSGAAVWALTGGTYPGGTALDPATGVLTVPNQDVEDDLNVSASGTLADDGEASPRSWAFAVTIVGIPHPPPAEAQISRWRLAETSGDFVDDQGLSPMVPAGTVLRGLDSIISSLGSQSIYLNGADAYLSALHAPEWLLQEYTVAIAFQMTALPAASTKWLLLNKDDKAANGGVLPPGGISIELRADGAGAVWPFAYSRNATGGSGSGVDIDGTDGPVELLVDTAYILYLSVDPAGPTTTLSIKEDDGTVTEVGTSTNGQGWQANPSPIYVGAYNGSTNFSPLIVKRVVFWNFALDGSELDAEPDPVSITFDPTAPVAVDDNPAALTSGSGAHDIDVLANDSYAGTPSISIISQTGPGTASVTGTGASSKIQVSANAGVGTKTVTYQLSHSANGFTSQALLTIAIMAAPAALEANSDTFAAVTENTGNQDLNVLGNDVYTDTPTITIVNQSGPGTATITGSGTGSRIRVSTAAGAGVKSGVYRLTHSADGNVAHDDASFSITINPAQQQSFVCIAGGSTIVVPSTNAKWDVGTLPNNCKIDARNYHRIQALSGPKSNAFYGIYIRGGAQNGCLSGGSVQGTQSLSIETAYNNLGNCKGFLYYASNGPFLLEGYRIHNWWDGVNLISSGSANLTIRGCWASWCRDDFTENDNNADGYRIEDCLLLDHFMIFSSRDNGGANYSSRTETITDCICSLGVQNVGVGGGRRSPSIPNPTTGWPFKLNGNSIRYDLSNNSFLITQGAGLELNATNPGVTDNPFYNLSQHSSKVKTSSGNKIYCTISGGWPSGWWIPPGFTIVTSSAQSQFDALVATWKANHPNVYRIPGVDT